MPGDIRSWESPQTLPDVLIGPLETGKQFQNLKFTVRRTTHIQRSVLSSLEGAATTYRVLKRYPASRVRLQQCPSLTFPTFIFPSVVRVSQLCLGLTFLLKCRVQKLGLNSRPSVLFDRFDRFILFWRDVQAITGKNFSQSEYVAVGTIFNLREAFHRAFHHVNLSNICSEQAFHSSEEPT